jgi:hypothetical protein
MIKKHKGLPDKPKPFVAQVAEVSIGSAGHFQNF